MADKRRREEIAHTLAERWSRLPQSTAPTESRVPTDWMQTRKGAQPLDLRGERTANLQDYLVDPRYNMQPSSGYMGADGNYVLGGESLRDLGVIGRYPQFNPPQFTGPTQGYDRMQQALAHMAFGQIPRRYLQNTNPMTGFSPQSNAITGVDVRPPPGLPPSREAWAKEMDAAVGAPPISAEDRKRIEEMLGEPLPTPTPPRDYRTEWAD